MSSRIRLVSLTEMLEYMLEMSSDANLVVGVIGVCFSLCISCVVFLILKEYGNGVRSWIFFVSSFASLYAGALLQFTTGHIG